MKFWPDTKANLDGFDYLGSLAIPEHGARVDIYTDSDGEVIRIMDAGRVAVSFPHHQGCTLAATHGGYWQSIIDLINFEAPKFHVKWKDEPETVK